MIAVPAFAVEIQIPGEPGWVSQARAFVSKFTEEAGLPEEDAFEVLVAMEEAAVNACCHGRRGPDAPEVRIRCGLEGDQVFVEVADDGRGFDMSRIDPTRTPDPLASEGRGIFIMHQLMDDVDIDASADGTTVRMRRRLHGHNAPDVSRDPRAGQVSRRPSPVQGERAKS